MRKNPWTDEPDREEFEHYGYPCLLNRNQFRAWCGYVAVPKSHPMYGKSFDEVNETVDVHGGLTYAYAGACHGSICHPGEGEQDDVWWFGFDCAHAYDLIPYEKSRLGAFVVDVFTGKSALSQRVYRDIEYVRNETKRLAEQLFTEALNALHAKALRIERLSNEKMENVDKLFDKLFMKRSVYRDIEYVRNDTKRLVEQLFDKLFMKGQK